MIRRAALSDAASFASIYNYFVLNTPFTFEEEPVSASEMEKRIEAVSADFPWYAWEEDGAVLGFAYLHKYHARSAYRYTAEDSVYVKHGCEGRGIGRALLLRLIEDAEKLKLHNIIAILGLPNPASEALHQKCGFEKLADFDEMGFKTGEWRGNGFWRLRI